MVAKKRGRPPKAKEKDASEDPEVLEQDSDDEISDGMVADLVTGEAVKLNEKEAHRQEEERKLLEEFGYEEADYKDLIHRNVRVKPRQLKAKTFPLAVLRGNKVSRDIQERLYILIDILPSKTKADDSKKGAGCLAEFLRDTPAAEYAVWTNGTERIVYWKKTDAIKTRTLLINDIPRFGKDLDDSFAPGRKSSGKRFPVLCARPFADAMTTSMRSVGDPTKRSSGSSSRSCSPRSRMSA